MYIAIVNQLTFYCKISNFNITKIILAKKWPIPSGRKAWQDDFQRSSFAAFEEFDSNLWNVNVTVG